MRILLSISDGNRLATRKLTRELLVTGRHEALPGHNRDTSVEVTLRFKPCHETGIEIPKVQAGLELLFDEAIAGLCEVLFESGKAVSGFKIDLLQIRPEPLDALLPISCRKAARVAAQKLIETMGSTETMGSAR
jgi:hypothetical protein